MSCQLPVEPPLDGDQLQEAAAAVKKLGDGRSLLAAAAILFSDL